jgi:hypothetical protein
MGCWPDEKAPPTGHSGRGSKPCPFATRPYSTSSQGERSRMPTLRLNTDELDLVLNAAAPLDAGQRESFIQAVAGELADCGELGPGVVYRAIAAATRPILAAQKMSASIVGEGARRGLLVRRSLAARPRAIRAALPAGAWLQHLPATHPRTADRQWPQDRGHAGVVSRLLLRDHRVAMEYRAMMSGRARPDHGRRSAGADP